LPKELFEQLKIPEDEAVIKEFVIWQKKESYVKGEFFISYPSELDFMNKKAFFKNRIMRYLQKMLRLIHNGNAYYHLYM